MNIAIDAIDLATLIVYLIVVVLFGLWVGGKQRDLSTYLLGGRNLPWWAILGSIVATETSTATFLSVPALAFASDGGDLRFLQLAIGYIVGRVTIVWLLLPLYFHGQLFTAYEVLERRFGGMTKTAASIIFLVTRNLGDGVRLFLTAIALEKVANLPLPTCVIVIGIATIAYTFLGGMKAVVWNDCLQFLVYMAGGLLAAIVIVQRLPGGLEQVVNFAQSNDKFHLFDFQLSLSEAHTFWAGLIGGAFLTLGTHGTDQMMVQRYLCARTQRDAGRALIASGFVVLLQFAFFLLVGVGLACYYQHFAPERTFKSGDHVFATFIVEQMPAKIGIIGLVLAAVFSAAMSTLSSSLNSSAASATNDLYAPLFSARPSESHLLWVSRILTIAFGVIQIIIGIVAYSVVQNVVTAALSIAGFSAGLLLGVFVLGVLTRRTSEKAALLGLLCGLYYLIAVRFIIPPVCGFMLAWPWLPLVGSVTTLGFGVAFGFLLDTDELSESA